MKKIKQMKIERSDGITECWVLNKDYRELEKKYEELSNKNNSKKKYDEMIINGDKYFVLNVRENEIDICKFDLISKEDVKKYFTDKWYIDIDCDVRYNSDIRDNKYENSYIFKVLNGAFKKDKLKGFNIIGNVRLLTKEEVEELDMKHRKTSRYGFWTMAPYNNMDDLSSGEYARVFCVGSLGNLDWYSVDNTFGVRPVITLSTDEL